jgi:hypothetical protein
VKVPIEKVLDAMSSNDSILQGNDKAMAAIICNGCNDFALTAIFK